MNPIKLIKLAQPWKKQHLPIVLGTNGMHKRCDMNAKAYVAYDDILWIMPKLTTRVIMQFLTMHI